MSLKGAAQRRDRCGRQIGLGERPLRLDIASLPASDAVHSALGSQSLRVLERVDRAGIVIHDPWWNPGLTWRCFSTSRRGWSSFDGAFQIGPPRGVRARNCGAVSGCERRCLSA